jgi:hypothetical protein
MYLFDDMDTSGKASNGNDREIHKRKLSKSTLSSCPLPPPTRPMSARHIH